MSDFLIDEELLADIDMGSNSFHLAIARVDHGEVKKVASMSEKVQLAAGLDENKNFLLFHSMWPNLPFLILRRDTEGAFFTSFRAQKCTLLVF